MSDFWSGATPPPPPPVPKPKRRFRWRWVWIGLAGFVVLLAIVPKPPRPTPQQVAVEKAEAAAATARKAVESKTLLNGEAKKLWSEIVAAAGACDTAAAGVAGAAETGDRYELYRAATAGVDGCRRSHRAIKDLDAPASATGDVEDAFEIGIETCASAQIARQIAFDKVAEVANGDMRPSAMEDARESMKTAGMGGTACAAGMVEAAAKGGLDSSIFDVAK